ncbi:thiol reductant ABC exporter subunit CydD [Sphaerisporangium siamense]|uniref:ATP-binding cassette subfamily C protein/ATP-binding cassette subfamily C protein CydD n=1 Tax=Sphaerisporangium siamense TaxID=795645 RepID=A0A7W7DFG5_9ACTN|nr:thiol reductant ABC exporter subunit CydD [Sphaerisporangium siamense]MBB4704373.1 ATP-binding cassette subfamily C protein/ATP-binding cassette subfamily C protein CydD [Sphaerisporangium siamense]GII84946.1 thiol reductant ABC exporter subunit CydD [Sphaerisporangium siamense]
MHKDLLLLARTERAVRRHLLVCVAAAVLAGLLVLAQAELLSGVLSGALTTAALLPLAGVVAARALFGLLHGAAAGRTASALKSVLRGRLLARFGELGPARLASRRSGELVTLAGRGLDALDPYVTGYLPAVAVAGVVPVAVLARLFAADLATAVIVLVTLPLIPVFGALVGWRTKEVTDRQWRALSQLGGHFLDVVRGLPTLRAFGRARYQATVIRQVADAHRAATMRTLRVAFLSSLVLELVASLSLALVAVPVGLRLLSGSLDLRVALLVLLLAPEAYIPLRAMGTKFHAAMEGVAAADDAFAVLDDRAPANDAAPGERWTSAEETPSVGAAPSAAPEREALVRSSVHAVPEAVPVRGTVAGRIGAVPAGVPEIRLEDVTVRYPGREDAALSGVSLVIAPGERVALTGESGAGKSTLLHLLLGFVTPTRGRVLVGGIDLADLAEADLGLWRARLAFVPQRPHLFADTVSANIAMGSGASAEDVRAAAGAARAAEFVAALPDGYATVLGERGADLSAGQRQRLALARAFCRPGAEVLLLDEPTARLDGRSEAAIVEATRALAEGRTAVIVAHRPAMIDLADRVIRVEDGRVVSDHPVPRVPAGLTGE